VQPGGVGELGRRRQLRGRQRRSRCVQPPYGAVSVGKGNVGGASKAVRAAGAAGAAGAARAAGVEMPARPASRTGVQLAFGTVLKYAQSTWNLAWHEAPIALERRGPDHEEL